MTSILLAPGALRRPNDLLIGYDRLPEDERLPWLEVRLGNPELGQAFHACARDEATRGLLEYRLNANLPLEAYRLLEDRGVLRREPEPFRTHVPVVAGAELHAVVLDRGRAGEVVPRLGSIDPEDLLAGAVMGYALRDAGSGAVLRRDFLEAALAVGDVDVLSHAVDPAPSGAEPVIELLGGASLSDPDRFEIFLRDPEGVRRKTFPWWGAAPGHGTLIHDLTRQPEAAAKSGAGQISGDDLLEELRPRLAGVEGAVRGALRPS